MTHDMPQYYTIRDASKMLGIGDALTRRLARRAVNPLPTIRLGRLVRVPRAAFLQWLANEGVEQARSR